MPNSSSIQSPIGKRLIIYIVLFSSFITLFITAIQLYRDYSIDINHIHNELEQIEDVHLKSLSAALWTSNTKLLQTSIEGILKIEDMQYIEIRDEQKVWAKVGEIKGTNNIQRSFPMFYWHRNKNVNIGTLTVSVSLNGVYQRLLDKVWVILISNGIKTALVSFFIYFLFYRMVTRHLSTISEFSKKHEPLSNNTKLSLDRNQVRHDEFDAMVNSINNMHTRLHEQLTEINQQKQYLSQTLNSIGDAVVTTDNEGNVTRLNPVAEQLTGWTNDEAHKQPLKTIFPIIDATTRAAITNPVEKVLATGETVYLSNHTTLIAKDGTEYQIADSAAAIRNEEKKILGMVLVFNDVTEQYQVREALKQSEQKYQTLATVSPVGVFYTNADGHCLYVNEKWCEIAGMTAEEASEHGWINCLHPDDRDRVFSEWSRSAKNRVPFKLEYRFKQPDGIHWVLGQAHAELNKEGEVVGYVGTITDITAIKKAEEAMLQSARAMADAQRMAHIGSWKLNLVSNELQWSDEIYCIFELDPEEFTPSYEAFINAVHPDDRDEVVASYTESVKNKTPYNIEHRLRMPDGRIKYVHERCETFYDAAGNPVCSTGTVQDITEQYNMEERLRRTQKMDALGKLTGGVAHDYNNMLGVVLGYSELLRDQLNEQPKLQVYVDKITHAGERGAKLTRKLLAFSKIKSSDACKFDINTLIHEEQHMLEKTLTARIKLELKLENNLWPVCLDESELEDAILNLCINAMHAIENNGQLAIETKNTQITEADAEMLGLDAGDYTRLSITDTGCGIDDTSKERIFDPFYSTKGENGTGLGLSQVYGFITRCGGAISVDSILEQGTEFTLYFPRYQGEDDKTNPGEIKSKPDVKGNETILVVDDEPALLELTCEILNQKNYQVFRAQHAKQALEIMATEHIDLLISDVIMPDMNGYKLASIVQQKYPNIKIQLASGYSGEEQLHKVDENLSQNLLQKPYNAQMLLKRIQILLQH